MKSEIIEVSEEFLVEMLGLPEGTKILGANDSALTDCESQKRVLTLKVMRPSDTREVPTPPSGPPVTYGELERQLAIHGDVLKGRLDRITRDLADGTISVAQARALIGLTPL